MLARQRQSQKLTLGSSPAIDENSEARHQKSKVDISIESAVEEMRIAMRGRKPDDAIRAFWKWVDEEAEMETPAKGGKKPKSVSELRIPCVICMVINVTHIRNSISTQSRGLEHLPRSFVSGSVEALSSSSAPLSRDEWAVVRPAVDYLMKRRVLTNGILRTEGGVVRMLGDRGDWVRSFIIRIPHSSGLTGRLPLYRPNMQELIKICLQTLPDIPEAEIIRLLRRSVDVVNAKKPSSTAEAMDVDPPASNLSSSHPQAKESYSSALPPSEFLALTLSYPLSSSLVRPALRKYFGSDVEALLPILRTLTKWVVGVAEDEAEELGGLISASKSETRESGEQVKVGAESQSRFAINSKRVDVLGRTLIPLEDGSDDDDEDSEGGEGRNMFRVISTKPREKDSTVKKGAVFSVAQLDYHRRPPIAEVSR